MSESTDRIAELIRQGRKIEAIKLLRETTGVDLKRAKEEIERLEAMFDPTEISSASETATGSTALPPEVEELALQGKKIEAIKLLREQAGIGLKEAKNRVETVTGLGSGCLGRVM